MTVATLFQKAVSFTVTSGKGWLIDFTIFYVLTVFVHAHPFPSNVFSAFVAVSYVYVVSVRHIFVHNGHYLLRKFFMYLLYQALAIVFFSWVIAQGAVFLNQISSLPAGFFHGHAAVIAKIIVTPVTLFCNFLFMRWLVEVIGND